MVTASMAEPDLDGIRLGGQAASREQVAGRWYLRTAAVPVTGRLGVVSVSSGPLR
jgi:hypothetical protein